MRLIRSDCFDAFKERGVPPTVLLASHPENIKKHINIVEIPKDTGSVVMDQKKQLAALEKFEKSLASKSSSKPFFLLASRSYDFVAAQFALAICANLVQNTGKHFWWHSVYGNTHDALRDDKENAKKILKDCNLLVISNCAENDTAMKTEKVRDLLNMYSHLPRVLVVGGTDPVTYSKTKLHVLPDLYISC